MAGHHYMTGLAGQWFYPAPRGHRMACCDCGLVHAIDYQIRGRRVAIRIVRDNRATAAMRREERKRQETR